MSILQAGCQKLDDDGFARRCSCCSDTRQFTYTDGDTGEQKRAKFVFITLGTDEVLLANVARSQSFLRAGKTHRSSPSRSRSPSLFLFGFESAPCDHNPFFIISILRAMGENSAYNIMMMDRRFKPIHLLSACYFLSKSLELFDTSLQSTKPVENVLCIYRFACISLTAEPVRS